jgi:hypothetical protein
MVIVHDVKSSFGVRLSARFGCQFASASSPTSESLSAVITRIDPGATAPVVSNPVPSLVSPKVISPPATGSSDARSTLPSPELVSWSSSSSGAGSLGSVAAGSVSAGSESSGASSGSASAAVAGASVALGESAESLPLHAAATSAPDTKIASVWRRVLTNIIPPRNSLCTSVESCIRYHCGETCRTSLHRTIQCLESMNAAPRCSEHARLLVDSTQCRAEHGGATFAP